MTDAESGLRSNQSLSAEIWAEKDIFSGRNARDYWQAGRAGPANNAAMSRHRQRTASCFRPLPVAGHSDPGMMAGPGRRQSFFSEFELVTEEPRAGVGGRPGEAGI